MSWIVCGWYTPDYTPWADALEANLTALGVPHEIVRAEKRGGGWEANTLAKPEHVRDAITRHPGKTVIFLDVDCIVTGTAADLDRLQDIGGDIGLFIRTRVRKNGSAKFVPRSGTLVLRPTPAAALFVDAWVIEAERAPRYAVDQDALLVALGRVPHLSITTLPVAACATEGDKVAEPIILHESASRGLPKAGRLARALEALRFKSRQLRCA